MLAERESRLEPLLQCIEPERVQPPGLRCRPCRLRKTKQCRAAPEGKRVGDGVRRSARVTGAESGAGSGEQLLELAGVDECVLERVPVRGESDRVCPKCPAKPCHMVLHRVSRRSRKLASPERFDQRVRRHDPTCTQGQTGDKGLPLRARHLHWMPGDDHLERPQKPNFELSHWRVLRSLEQSGTPGGAV